MTVYYTNHRSEEVGVSWWGGRVQVLVWLHRSAYTMAAGKRGKQTIFRPAASSKKYEKKIIKNPGIVESQDKYHRKDVNASHGEFMHI